MKRKLLFSGLFLFFILWGSMSFLLAESIFPVAILSFTERGAGMKGQGENVRDLLFAGLVDSPEFILVERGDLDKMLKEAELNLSGIVSADQSIQIGQLTGAKILITGSVFKIGNTTYLVAKIIGTETGRVLGQSVNGVDDLEVLARKLAKLVKNSLKESAQKLVAAHIDRKMRIERVRVSVKGQKLPDVLVDISEEHIGVLAKDAAAETEMIYFYKELGGRVIDKLEGDTSRVEYRIVGEGFSESSIRHQNLVSVKARLEVKILDKNGDIVAIDRQTTIKVDLNEMLAAKSALQEASLLIAERIIPKMVKAK